MPKKKLNGYRKSKLESRNSIERDLKAAEEFETTTELGIEMESKILSGSEEAFAWDTTINSKYLKIDDNKYYHENDENDLFANGLDYQTKSSTNPNKNVDLRTKIDSMCNSLRELCD